MHNAIARAWPTTNFSRIYNLVTAVSCRKEGSNSSKLRSPHEIDSPIFIARHVPFSSLFFGSPGTLEEYIWPRYLFPSFLLLLNIILILVNTCLYIRIYDEKNLKKKEKSNRNTQIERVVKFLLEIERLSLSLCLSSTHWSQYCYVSPRGPTLKLAIYSLTGDIESQAWRKKQRQFAWPRRMLESRHTFREPRSFTLWIVKCREKDHGGHCAQPCLYNRAAGWLLNILQLPYGPNANGLTSGRPFFPSPNICIIFHLVGRARASSIEPRTRQLYFVAPPRSSPPFLASSFDRSTPLSPSLSLVSIWKFRKWKKRKKKEKKTSTSFDARPRRIQP